MLRAGLHDRRPHRSGERHRGQDAQRLRRLRVHPRFGFHRLRLVQLHPLSGVGGRRPGRRPHLRHRVVLGGRGLRRHLLHGVPDAGVPNRHRGCSPTTRSSASRRRPSSRSTPPMAWSRPVPTAPSSTRRIRGFYFTDTFTYEIRDANQAVMATSVVTIVVDEPTCIAVDDAYSTTVDTPLAVGAPGVLANDQVCPALQQRSARPSSCLRASPPCRPTDRSTTSPTPGSSVRTASPTTSGASTSVTFTNVVLATATVVVDVTETPPATTTTAPPTPPLRPSRQAARPRPATARPRPSRRPGDDDDRTWPDEPDPSVAAGPETPAPSGS